MSSSFSKEKSNVERCCANSTCDKAGVHLCAGCGEEIYCSKDCQKAHWQSHKVQCQNALRPKAAVSSSQSFDALSVKQLKNVMKAKAGTFDAIKRTKILEQLDHIIERPALIKFVSEHIQPAEVDKLLATPESSSKAQASRPSEPKKKKEVLPPVPSPDQMRQQATMMRKNPDLGKFNLKLMTWKVSLYLF